MKKILFLSFLILFLSLFAIWQDLIPHVFAQSCVGSPPACGPTTSVCNTGYEVWDTGYVDYSPLSLCGGVLRLVDKYQCRAEALVYCTYYYTAECVGGSWSCVATGEYDYGTDIDLGPASCVIDSSGPYCGLPTNDACASCGGPPVNACTPTAPSAPALVAPSNGATVASAGTTLDWNPVSSWGDGCGGSNTYRVYMEANDSTPDILVATKTSGITAHATGALTSGVTYYWKIRADNGSLFTDSVVRNFTVSSGSTCSANTPYASWGEDIIAGQTLIKASHFTGTMGIRTRINERRALVTGLGQKTWASDATGVLAAGNVIRAAHIEEMRNAIAEVYTACSQTPPAWTDSPLVVNSTKIRKIHIDELRDAISNAPKKP